MKSLFALLFLLLAQFAMAQQSPVLKGMTVTNETAINSEDFDYSPAFYEDGVAFISNRPSDKKLKYNDKNIKQNTFSLFKATRQVETGKLGRPELFLGAMNTRLHEGPLSFNAQQDEMYFCQNNQKDGKEIKARDKKVKMNLYKSTQKGKVWNYESAPIFADFEYDYMHPSVSADGKRLFFSSNRPGGLGGMDLYVSDKTAKGWSEPRNLGAPINTPANEVFPCIHADGTLFFSTDVPGGSGGLDLVFAHPDEKTWNVPTNLGTPFNTDKDDFALIVDLAKKNGYFSSSRPGGKGNDDIYSFYSPNPIASLPEPEVPQLTVKVVDEKTGDILTESCFAYYSKNELLNAEVMKADANGAITLQTTEGQSALRPVQGGNACTDEKGIYLMPIPPTPLLFNVDKPGYLARQITYVPTGKADEMVIPMTKDEKTVLMVLTMNEEGTSKPIVGGKMILRNEQTGVEKAVYTDPLGKFKANLPCDEAYALFIEKDTTRTFLRKTEKLPCDTIGTPAGMSGDSLSIPKSSKVIEQTQTLPKPAQPAPTPAALAEGAIIRLPNIYYNFNDAQIRQDASKDLDQIVVLMTQFETLEIELGSHTDSRGNSEYNAELSQRRAVQARQYIVDKGIPASRITAKGYGEQALLNNCADGSACSEFEHQRNRRTEVKVTKSPKNVTTETINNLPQLVDAAPQSVIDFSGGAVANPTPKENKTVSTVAPKTSVEDPSKPTPSTEIVSTSTAAPAPYPTSGGKIIYDKSVRLDKPAGTYILIAGSFSSVENARNQANRLAQLGVTADVRHEHSLKLVSVVVGPYEKLSLALTDAERLSENGVDVFLTRPRK